MSELDLVLKGYLVIVSSSKISAVPVGRLSGGSEMSILLSSPVTVPLRTRWRAFRARTVVRRPAVAACVHLRTVRKGRSEN